MTREDSNSWHEKMVEWWSRSSKKGGKRLKESPVGMNGQHIFQIVVAGLKKKLSETNGADNRVQFGWFNH